MDCVSRGLWPSSKLQMRVSQSNNEADQRLLWTMKFYEEYLEKNPGNIVGGYAGELRVFPTTISCHLKLIRKVIKMDKCVSYELNENHKCKRFEISSACLLRNQNDPFLNRIVTYDEKWILYDNCKRSAY